MKFLFTISFSLSMACSYSQVYDYEDNAYNTIQIGSQTWMSENLKTSKYNNGDDIPNVTDDQDWIY